MFPPMNDLVLQTEQNSDPDLSVFKPITLFPESNMPTSKTLFLHLTLEGHYSVVVVSQPLISQTSCYPAPSIIANLGQISRRGYYYFTLDISNPWYLDQFC